MLQQEMHVNHLLSQLRGTLQDHKMLVSTLLRRHSNAQILKNMNVQSHSLAPCLIQLQLLYTMMLNECQKHEW